LEVQSELPPQKPKPEELEQVPPEPKPETQIHSKPEHAYYLFISYPENHNETDQIGDEFEWTCSRTTKTGDYGLVYVTRGGGIKYKFLVISDAEKRGHREYWCNVKYIDTFDPPVSLAEICAAVAQADWPPPHLNFRGYTSLRIPDNIVGQILSLR
jgi:hypothetical protein